MWLQEHVTRWSWGTCMDLVLLMHDAYAVEAGTSQNQERDLQQHLNCHHVSKITVLEVNLIRVVTLAHP